jgi:hypothetical protein
LVRAVEEIRQQECFRELTELDEAPDDVLADAVQNTEAKTVLTNELEHNRLKRGPALAPAEVGDRCLEIVNSSRSTIYEKGPGSAPALLRW